jgi:hypothetical protein
MNCSTSFVISITLILIRLGEERTAKLTEQYIVIFKNNPHLKRLINEYIWQDILGQDKRMYLPGLIECNDKR